MKRKYYYLKQPRLQIINLEDRRDSEIFIRNKIKIAEEIGFEAKLSLLPKSSNLKEFDVIEFLQEQNNNPDVNGIVV